jgi:putative redox protein
MAAAEPRTVRHVARAIGSTSAETPPYGVEIRTGRHHLTADESVAGGGADVGPSPFGLLMSGLVACTVTTLRMYAARKDWDVPRIEVDARYLIDDDGSPSIERTITVSGDLDPEQRQRLAEIAERTPVTRAIRSGTPIVTTMVVGSS